MPPLPNPAINQPVPAGVASGSVAKAIGNAVMIVITSAGVLAIIVAGAFYGPPLIGRMATYVKEHASSTAAAPVFVPTNLPAGYPASLPEGQYNLQLCTSGAASCADSGTFPLSGTNSSEFVQAIPGAVAAAKQSCPSCTVQVSPWNGIQFVITVSNGGFASKLYVSQVG
jgi:hypothetical protein